MQIGLGLALPQSSHLAAQPPPAYPRKRLRGHDRDVAGFHLANLNAAKAVILDAKGKGRIGQRVRLWHALLFGADLRPRLGKLGTLLHGLVDEHTKHRIV